VSLPSPCPSLRDLKIICSAEFVRWVAESKRSFQIVNDRGFRSLMKTGRPECYIPSTETVFRDVKDVFVRVRERIAKMLQVSSHLQNLSFQPTIS